MEDFLRKKLQERIASNALRTLPKNHCAVDFSSNDYLGFSRSINIQQHVANYLKNKAPISFGATGSRLISGNSELIENLEQEISEFHDAKAALIFNSGYDANLGLLSSVSQKGDTIICDELAHASILDGARLSLANKFSFKHNDLENLEIKLKNCKGNIFLATESIFSMDGDAAPILELTQLAKKYNAHLIVDEAHALGVFGKNGEGLVNALGLDNEVFARVVTFGKAMGCHGAAVLGSEDLRNYLINFARSFIYTTALPVHSILNIKYAYAALKENNLQQILHQKIALFKSLIKEIQHHFIESESAIQCIVIPGNEECKRAAQLLQEKNLAVKAILNPTVPLGKERIRICLHAYNSNDEIILLSQSLKKLCL